MGVLLYGKGVKRMKNVKALPFYNDLSDEAKNHILRTHQTHTFEVNTRISENHPEICQDFFIVTAGLIRVYRTTQDGKTVSLYDIEATKLCPKNIACLLRDEPYHAHAITKSQTTLITLPPSSVMTVLFKEPAFVRFMMNNVLGIMDTMMFHYEAMSFAPVKARIRMQLEKLSQGGMHRIIYTTHEDIAREIGATREAVSRHLKALEHAGTVELKRGKIKLLNPLQ